MRRRFPLALLVMLIALGATAAVRAATTPDFSVSAAPSTQTITSGSSGSYVTSIVPSNGFAGTVTLTAGNLPKGTSASWSVNGTNTSSSSVSVTVPAGSRGTSATLTIGGGQPPAGSYNPTVSASSGSLTHTATLTLAVVNQNAANFGLSVSPSAQAVAQGAATSSAVSITRVNTTAAVSFPTPAVSPLPAGATATLTPSPATGSASSLTINTSSSTPPGFYTLTLTGNATLSGATTSRYAAFTLVVQGATTTTASGPATDATAAAIPPSSISSTLAGATSDASGTITFKVFGPQATAPTTCTTGGSTVGSTTVSGNGTYHPSAGFAPPTAGTYWWYASYTGDSYNTGSSSTCGSGMASTVVKNTTSATAAAPPTGTATASIPSSSISSTLSGATSGAAGTITYRVFGPQPSAPTTCTTGGTTVGTAAVSGSNTYHPNAGFTPATGGTYWWYASYSGDAFNSPSNSACGSGMASTVVGDISVSASPSTQSALTGGNSNDSAAYTVTVTPTSGFSGTVNLNVTGLPSGATGSFSPASTSGSSASNSTLTVDVGTAVAPGSYTLTVKGSASSPSTLTRSIQVTLAIQGAQPFKISGDVPSPLYPGAPAQPFNVTLTNPNSFSIHVTSLGSVGIQPVGAPGCLAGWFQVTLPSVPSGGIAVAGGASVTLNASARMLNVNAVQDACKGKHLTLSYTGSYAK